MRGGEAFAVAAAAFGPEAPDEGEIVRASGQQTWASPNAGANFRTRAGCSCSR